jgi:hypothetical protein
MPVFNRLKTQGCKIIIGFIKKEWTARYKGGSLADKLEAWDEMTSTLRPGKQSAASVTEIN